MKIKLLISFVLLFTFLSPISPVFGSYKMGENKPVKTGGAAKSKNQSKFSSLDKTSKTENPEEAALAALSERFLLSVDRLKYFRSLHHGFEEIVPALIVAREAQVEVGLILQSRMTNSSWKTIAETYDIDLQPLNDEVESVIKPLRKRLNKKSLEERPENRKLN